MKIIEEIIIKRKKKRKKKERNRKKWRNVRLFSRIVREEPKWHDRSLQENHTLRYFDSYIDFSPSSNGANGLPFPKKNEVVWCESDKAFDLRDIVPAELNHDNRHWGQSVEQPGLLAASQLVTGHSRGT